MMTRVLTFLTTNTVVPIDFNRAGQKIMESVSPLVVHMSH